MPESTDTHVVFCCNSRFFKHMAVTACSLLANNPSRRFQIHVVHSDFDAAEFGKAVEAIGTYRNAGIARYPFDVGPVLHFFTRGHLTIESYLRIFVPKLLSESVSRVIYLDCDLIIVDRIDYLCELDLGRHIIAAVPDVSGERRRQELGLLGPYVNMGVMVMNLAEWRRLGCTERITATIESSGSALTFVDQDAINIELNKKIMCIDRRWNYSAWHYRRYWSLNSSVYDRMEGARKSMAIIHFHSAEKPWQFGAVVPGKELYWRFRRRTPWSHWIGDDVRLRGAMTYPIKMLLHLSYINHFNMQQRLGRLLGRARSLGASSGAGQPRRLGSA